MSSDLWFGTTKGFRLITPPDMDLQVQSPGFSDGFTLENGGEVRIQSAASAKVFTFGYNIRPKATFDWLRRIRNGAHGTNLKYFADPETFNTNVIAPAWAEPGLIEQGWPSIYDAAPTFANTAANAFDQPLRSAVFNITQAAATAPAGLASRLIVPIPPDMTLYLGASGSATGTGQVYVTAYNIAAGTSAGGALTLLSATASTRLNATYAGSAYDYVAIDLRRSSAVASAVTLTSLLGQLWLTGSSPTLTGNHVGGEGHTGLRMVGWDETYRNVDARGLAFSLVEVGAWLQ